MYLKKLKTSSGRIHLSICQNYRDTSGKNRTRTFKTIGYVDQFTALYENPIAHFEEEVRIMNEQYQSDNAPIEVSFTSHCKLQICNKSCRNIGYFVFSHYYHALSMDQFWHNRRPEGHKSDFNALFRLAVWTRLLYPDAEFFGLEKKTLYFDRCTFGPDEVRGAFPYLAACGSDIGKWIGKALADIEAYKDSNIYHHIISSCLPEDAPAEPWAPVNHKKPSRPLYISVAINNKGVPVDFRLIPKHSANRDALLNDVLENAHTADKRNRTVIVADASFDTSESIVSIILAGNGYVISQSLDSKDTDLEAWITENEGYRKIGDMYAKSRRTERLLVVTDTEGRRHSARIPIRQIALSNSSYDDLPITPSSGKNETATSAALGFHCLVTSELEAPEEQLLEIYRETLRLEKAFLPTQVTFSPNNDYAPYEQRVKVHFTISYVALTLLRLLQADTGNRFSEKTIRSELIKLECSHLKDKWWHFHYRSDITDALCEAVGIDLTYEVRSLSQIKKTLAQTRKRTFDKE